MDLQVKAREARDAARAAADAAAAEAASIAAEKDELIAEMARLQDISVKLAERRQSALEEQAAEAAAAAAEAAARRRPSRPPRRPPSRSSRAGQQQEQPSRTQDAGRPGAAGRPRPRTPHPTQPPPTPPSPPSPPAPSGGAGAAIGFARAQIGEPYRWGAAGPSAWDCSGLTMGAWQRGRQVPARTTPWRSTKQSTPISPGSLQPGDLLFWGSSSSPSSIYHVALYVGGGQMIHAPRTGRPVDPGVDVLLDPAELLRAPLTPTDRAAATPGSAPHDGDIPG